MHPVHAPAAGIELPPSGPATLIRSGHVLHWDTLRIVASLDTIGLHLTGEHGLWGVGLPMFLMLGIALSVSKTQLPTPASFLRARAKRILLPWLFWSLLLLVGRVAEQAWYARPLLSWLEWRMLLFGPSIHLWFLPFVFFAGSFATWWSQRMERVQTAMLAPLAVALGLVTLAVSAMTFASGVSLGWPFEQWVFAAPAVPFGIALGRWMAGKDIGASLERVFVAGLAVALIALHSPQFTARYTAAGLILIFAVFVRSGVKDAVWKRLHGLLIPTMMGVYILHIEVHRHLTKPMLRAFGLANNSGLRVAFAFVATVLLVMGLRRTWLRQFL